MVRWKRKRRWLAGSALGVGLIAAACGGAIDRLDEAPIERVSRPTAEDIAAVDPAPAPLVAGTETASSPDRLGPNSLFLPVDAAATPDGDPILRDGLRPRGVGSEWRTNWNVRSVDPNEVMVVLGRDWIRAIDAPKFVDIVGADTYLSGNHPVIQVEIDGDVRAFPLGILTSHEIVNTTVGGVPLAVTFCPLCNSAIAFERTLNGTVVEFGVSGMLRNSDLIMFDRATDTLWQQLTGEAIFGGLVGAKLTPTSAPLVSYDQFRERFPDGLVLSTDTGFGFSYSTQSYVGYDSGGPYGSFFPDDPDPRLPPNERVVALELDDGVAYPFSLLQEVRVVNDTRGGAAIVVVWTPGTASSLDTRVIADGRDVGASGVFSRALGGRLLTFVPNPADDRTFLDEQTGSVWDIFGTAIAGALTGARLTPIVHGDHFWFAWAAFFPNTALVLG